MMDTENGLGTQGVVDWSKPIEAVHEDGRVVAANLSATKNVRPDAGGQYHVESQDGFALSFFNADGTAWSNHGWRIRNTTPATPKWGPEIAVAGKRPEWLGDDGQEISGRYSPGAHDWYRGDADLASAFDWKNLVSFRLPANHPHYAAKLARGTSHDQLERMEALEALLKRVAADDIPLGEYLDIKKTARALLPESVDPDLVEARRIVAEALPHGREDFLAGKWDNTPSIQVPLACLKRGRELAGKGK